MRFEKSYFTCEQKLCHFESMNFSSVLTEGTKANVTRQKELESNLFTKHVLNQQLKPRDRKSVV